MRTAQTIAVDVDVRAALYGRYSTDKQRMASIEDQFRECTKRTTREGWQIVERYADTAKKGRDKTRKGYAQMMLDAAAKRFNVLVVDMLSRLGRDQDEVNQSIKRLMFQRIRVISIADGYDSAAKGEKLVRTLKNFMNDAALDDYAHMIKRGLEGVFLKGYWIGRPPYGYRLEADLSPTEKQYGQPKRIGTFLRIDRTEAAVYRSIVALYLNGASCRQIAIALNKKGIPEPGKHIKTKAKGWVPCTVRAMLSRPIYTGLILYRRQESAVHPDTGRSVWRDNTDKKSVLSRRDESLRIISDDTFKAVQARTKVCAAEHSTFWRSGGKKRHLLSGLLRCGLCNSAWVTSNEHYVCNGWLAGQTCKSKVRVRRDRLQQTILGGIMSRVLAPERVEKFSGEMQRAIRKQVAESKQAAVQAPAELKRIQRRIRELESYLENGHPSFAPDELAAALAVARQKATQLEKPVAQVSSSETKKMLAVMMRTARLYSQELAACMNGQSPELANKVRTLLRSLFVGGAVELAPAKSGVRVRFAMNPAALLGIHQHTSHMASTMMELSFEQTLA